MSKLALRLIAENKNTRSTFLDLGNCDLTEVPAELGELVWLEELSFASGWRDGGEWKDSANNGPANRLQRLTPSNGGWWRRWWNNFPAANPFAGLTCLRRLWLQGDFDNPFELSDLSHLAGLTQLQELDVSYTKVADLSPLAGLIQLQKLFVWHIPVADLSPLSGLAQLQMLSVSYTKVADLSPLAGLVQLQLLFVSHTPVADLSPLSGLTQLQKLIVSSTKVADLSPLLPLLRQGVPVMWALFGEGNGIYVDDCPLTHPPVEVVQQGNAAILNYFQESAAQGVDYLYEAKLLIVGEGGAGKTSLLRRLYQPGQPLPEECETTKGIDIHRHDFTLDNGRRFRLNVWDFGGQEIYHATHQFFLTKRSLYVLLDDTRKDHKSVQDEGFKYWLEAVDQLSEHSPLLIFQNEKGGRSKAIDTAGIKGRFPSVKEVYRGNLEHPDAAAKLGEALAFYARQLPHIGEALPARWLDIRADIEAQAVDKPYIGRQDYFDLYARHLPFEREKALHLSRYFHDLGVFLHFQDDPLLVRTVILQNTWATEAVFKMLDDETVKDRLGRFTQEDCRRVWQDSAYADMHLELLALMQKFELCYRFADIQPDTWLVPQLLPPSKPAALSGWERPGDLVLRYRYEFMPKGLVNRLMVRQHRFVVQAELGWANGVLFAQNDTQLLAEIPAKGGEIVLRTPWPGSQGPAQRYRRRPGSLERQLPRPAGHGGQTGALRLPSLPRKVRTGILRISTAAATQTGRQAAGGMPGQLPGGQRAGVAGRCVNGQAAGLGKCGI